jgi:hypothetical protein
MLAKFKWYLVLGGIVLGLSLGLYYSLSALFTARSDLVHANAQVASLNELLAKARANADAAQVSANASGQVRGEVDHALSKNRAWGDSPVPDAVVDGLCKHLVCASSASQVSSSGNQPGK